MCLSRNTVNSYDGRCRLAVTPGQLDDLMAQLPSEFNVLFR